MTPTGRLAAIRPRAHAGWFVLLCIAVFFGLASAVLPGWFVFSVLLVPAVAALMLVRPEYGLTACAALVCGLIHPALVPRIPAFGGALAAADAALAMLTFYAVWSLAAQPRSAASTPVPGARLLAVALGLFGASLVVAVVASLSLREINPAHVLGETRDLLYLILLPIAVIILRQRERQERFVVSFVVLGCLFSVGQILQGVFNVPVFGAQGISALETLGRQDDETTRANTLGLNVIVFSLLLTVGAYALGAIRKPLFFATAGLLFVGIVLTFGRTTFAAVLICLAIVVPPAPPGPASPSLITPATVTTAISPPPVGRGLAAIQGFRSILAKPTSFLPVPTMPATARSNAALSPSLSTIPAASAACAKSPPVVAATGSPA